MVNKKLNLQFFAEGSDAESSSDGNGGSTQEPEKAYTQKEVDAAVARAITDYAKKSKSKVDKTSEDRISALEAEIARRDNMEYARKQIDAQSLPPVLAELFYSDSEESTDSRIEIFYNWYKEAIDKAVEEKLKGATPITTAPTSTQGIARKSLSDLQSTYNQSHR